MPDELLTVSIEQIHDPDFDLRALADETTIDDFEVLPVGTWNGDEYTEADLHDMVEAFGKAHFMVPVKVGVKQLDTRPYGKLGHSEDQKILQADGLPAAGWITKLRVEGAKLLATLSHVPRKVVELIRRKAYREISGEIFWNYRDPVDGTVYRRVLRAVGILGADIPAAQGKTPLDAHLALYADESSDGELHIAGVELHVQSEGDPDPMPTDTDKGKPAVTQEDLKQLTDQLAGLKAAVDSKDEKIAELQSQITVERTSRLSEEVVGFIDRAKRAGKLAPAEEPLAKVLLESADRANPKKYTVGEDQLEETPFAILKKLILNRPSMFDVTTEDRDSPKPKGEQGTEEFGGKKYSVDAEAKAAEGGAK
uniref:Putative structural protein n=1 Tax=viral metagenome TaxID=1070528 RepID=A0A6M3IPW8_9ZZZZ